MTGKDAVVPLLKEATSKAAAKELSEDDLLKFATFEWLLDDQERQLVDDLAIRAGLAAPSSAPAEPPSVPKAGGRKRNRATESDITDDSKRAMESKAHAAGLGDLVALVCGD